MLLHWSKFLALYAALGARAADSSTKSVLTISGVTLTGDLDSLPTGSKVSYLTYSSTKTVYGSDLLTLAGTATAYTTGIGNSNTTATTTSPSYTLLVGATRSSNTTLNGTVASSTTTTAQPTNTQPCNNYAEFCTRKYSNITEVCAHNSPFVRKGNAASNQQLDVTNQLNDGVRMLQGQTHVVNDTLYFCHTTCDLLNAGTVKDYLTTVANWVKAHPYDVITILLGNGDYVDVSTFVDPIQNSGLGPYLYEPSQIPMGLDDWPTLSYLILRQKRVIIFMDYKADQEKVPYILDEFSQLWETPFSPTNIAFPCTVERPPGITNEQARDRLYMANHNLNTEVSIGTTSLLIPNSADIAVTNGLNGTGSLGLAANQCTSDWGRPPNFLLVDFYNLGSPINGSVFQVAADMNNVTYGRECCGKVQSAAMKSFGISSLLILSWLAGFLLLLH